MCTIPTPPSLHSRYDPVKEASRFLDAQAFSTEPSIVVVTEPGESFLSGELRARYPDAKLVAVRYQDSCFTDTDRLWDSVWRPGNGRPVVPFLLDQIPDELLPLTVFIPWKPSESVWPETAAAVWQEIASLVRLQQSIMQTRAHFGKRWFSNMVWNAAHAERLSALKVTEKPVLLAAAGPSLDRLYPFDRDGFYICAVSAAVKSLLYRHYEPDLCVATDGGFWAREHLQELPDTLSLAFPLEAAIPSELLSSNPLVLLSYGSALENELFSLLRIAPIHAARNGTVAGTAAMLALSLTADNVYAAGLDLAPSRSFAHTRPYASDTRATNRSCRIEPDSNILYAQNRETASLDAYAEWFSSRNDAFRRRFFRIGSEGKYLEGIRSVSKDSVTPSPAAPNAPAPAVLPSLISAGERLAIVYDWLDACRTKIGDFVSETDVNPAAFHALLQSDQIIAELLSTVSYGEYVRYLKRSNASRSSAETISSIASVTADALAVIDKNMKRLETHG
jgi:hypothetical protein